MKSKAIKQLQIRVQGKVQGVGFRSFSEYQARKLGLVGQVQNQEDGSVSLVAEGEEATLKTFLEWASHGPDGARVDTMNSQWSDATGTYLSFSIR